MRSSAAPGEYFCLTMECFELDVAEIKEMTACAAPKLQIVVYLYISGSHERCCIFKSGLAPIALLHIIVIAAY